MIQKCIFPIPLSSLSLKVGWWLLLQGERGASQPHGDPRHPFPEHCLGALSTLTSGYNLQKHSREGVIPIL